MRIELSELKSSVTVKTYNIALNLKAGDVVRIGAMCKIGEMVVIHSDLN